VLVIEKKGVVRSSFELVGTKRREPLNRAEINTITSGLTGTHIFLVPRVALIKGDPGGVRARLKDIVGGGAQIWVSSVVAFELWYGASKSQNFERNALRLRDFFGGGWRVADFDQKDARRAGEVRTESQRNAGDREQAPKSDGKSRCRGK